MRWPWWRNGSNDRLTVSWSGHTLAFVHSKMLADGTHKVVRCGVEPQGANSSEEFIGRLQNLGLKGLNAQVMLCSEQYQFLTIDAPAVPDDELHSAALYQIKGMLKKEVNDITLDVMRVGTVQEEKRSGQLFVVAADNTAMRDILALSDAMNWNVALIDVQETAQRNLQSALAEQNGRATAALISSSGNSLILTIAANGALFYSRQFSLPEQPLVAPLEYGNDTSEGTFESNLSVSPITGEALDDTPHDAKMQRILLKVQRSLDIWNRSWTSMPLDGIQIYAGERSEELSSKFALAFGQTILPMDVSGLFPEFDDGIESEKALCLPLLGTLLGAPSVVTPQEINLFIQIKVAQKRYFLAPAMLKSLSFLLLLGGFWSSDWLSSMETEFDLVKQSMAMQSSEIVSVQGAIELRKKYDKARSELVQELEASRRELLQEEQAVLQRHQGLLRPGWGHAARLRLVAQSIPAQVWVTAMSANQGKFNIEGFTLEPAALSQWAAALSASPLLQGQKLSNVNLDDTGKAKFKTLRPVWSFNLVSAIPKPSATSAVKL
jgi:MSHA biogenesis protein MshI